MACGRSPQAQTEDGAGAGARGESQFAPMGAHQFDREPQTAAAGRAEPKNGRNRFSRALGGRPGPSSATSIAIVPVSRSAVKRSRCDPASTGCSIAACCLSAMTTRSSWLKAAFQNQSLDS